MDRSALKLARLFGVVAVLVALPVHAAYVFVQPQVLVPVATNGPAYEPGPYCTSRVAALNGSTGTLYSVHHVTDYYSGGRRLSECYVQQNSNGAGIHVGSLNGICPSPPTPAGSVVGGLTACYTTVAQCPNGQAPDAQGVCEVVCPAAGTGVTPSVCASASACVVRAGTSLGLGVCADGCAVRGVMGGTRDGVAYVWGPFTATGARCSGGEGGTPPGASAPPVTCPTPQCPGTVNGTAVCVACGSTQAPGSDTSTTGSDTAPGGTTTSTGSTTSTTTCAGTSCTTTTTTTVTGSDGTSSQQQQTTTEPRTSFCQRNPANPQCAGEDPDGSSFGGSCAGFTCEGDAVQCAMAREQHRRNCVLFDTATALTQVGVDSATGTDPADHPRAHAQTVSFDLASMINATPLFGASGSCPSDLSLSVLGQPVRLPFSSMCPYLTMAGAGFMMVCYLIAALIVFRRD